MGCEKLLKNKAFSMKSTQKTQEFLVFCPQTAALQMIATADHQTRNDAAKNDGSVKTQVRNNS